MYFATPIELLPLEIQQFITELSIKLKQQCPNTKVEIDENGTNVYTNINLDLFNDNQPNDPTVEVPPESSIPILNIEDWTEHEQRIILGINRLIQAGSTLETPIKWPASEEYLFMYALDLENNQYTKASIYFEIGRILSDLTNGLRTKTRITEAKNLYRRQITSTNAKNQSILAMRIYQYFKNYETLLTTKDIDNYLSINAIARINLNSSNSLSNRFSEYFNYLSQFFIGEQ
ncbi:MAG: hypothetical protein QOK89_00110 [Nitrososphaeraceae archaeon]|nr:hypothetical protein [Nitrososphaeraceae archaeon]